MATIRKRGNLQWQAIVKRRGYPLTSRTFETKKDAEAWARAAERDMDLGQFLPNRDAERTLLHELLERYRRDVLPSKRGAHFGTSLRVLDDRLGRYSLAAITSKVVADFRDARLHAGLSGSTVRQQIGLLSRIVTLAGREWGISLPANPCAMVSRPPENEGRTRRLEDGEEACLLAACPPKLAALVRLALATAARLGELIALRWTDVDFKDCVATIRGIDQRGTKNGDPWRDLPLLPDAIEVLEELPRDRDRVFSNWCASDSVNKPWTRALDRARAAYAAECKRTGEAPRAGFLEDLHFHDLRHEAITRLIESGEFSEAEVAFIAGHKTLGMVHGYTHLRAANIAKKKLGRSAATPPQEQEKKPG